MPELLNKILTCTYSDLFPHDKNEIEAQYRAYAKKVHPDINKDANAEATFRHLTELKDEALAALANGSWHEKGIMSFLRMVRACCQTRIIWNIIRILHLAILVYITSMKFSKNVILPVALMLTTFQEHI